MNKDNNIGLEEIFLGDDSVLKIQPDTIARTIILALTLINQILAICGKSTIPFAENSIYQMVSIGVTVVVSVYGFWKNNSFTRRALIGDMIKNALGGAAYED